MNPVLYFLRSTEQKIATDMLPYALRLDVAGKRPEDVPELARFERNYGVDCRDMGLYALSGHRVAGAAWIRLFSKENPPAGWVDEETPMLLIGVKPEFRNRGIGRAMMEQLLQEAGALYSRLSISVASGSEAAAFLERFGFKTVENSGHPSPVDGSEHITMIKALERGEVARPSDGYDPRRWMD